MRRKERGRTKQRYSFYACVRTASWTGPLTRTQMQSELQKGQQEGPCPSNKFETVIQKAGQNARQEGARRTKEKGLKRKTGASEPQ